MREVFAHCAGPRHDAEMTALAYYTAAICEQERRHVPLIVTAGESTPTPAYVVFERLSFSVGDAWSFVFHGDILAALGALLPASPHQIGTF